MYYGNQFVLALLLTASLCSGQKFLNGSRVMAGTMNYCAPTSGVDDYECTLEATLTAYVTGMHVRMKADVNTTDATIAVSGLAA